MTYSENWIWASAAGAASPEAEKLSSKTPKQAISKQKKQKLTVPHTVGIVSTRRIEWWLPRGHHMANADAEAWRGFE